MTYKGYEITETIESHLKIYGVYMFALPYRAADFARSIEDAKKKIDRILDDTDLEENGRFNDQGKNFCTDWDASEIGGGFEF